MNPTMQEVRKEYERGRLDEHDVDPDPLVVFGQWLEVALASGLSEPNAMALATATPNGVPSARIVLLKAYDARGFVFVTNYDSRKGRELGANPVAALTFWWGELERQVRIEGRVEKLPATESDEYYHNRPLGARLGAWVSQQSSVISDRAYLEQKLAELQAEYADQSPDRPPYWGGYRVIPDSIEFWQGGQHRLHDRLRYTRRPDGEWGIERLSP
ncbi:MAG: pyridoxamine 5'-phosphate oxidase [Anaerolineales bacterium]|nr:pyridoxamine 5'-phosphate oxidase [Anaerolineales bacterium]